MFFYIYSLPDCLYCFLFNRIGDGLILKLVSGTLEMSHLFSLIWYLLVWSVPTSFGALTANKQAPNILYIGTDQQRTSTLKCYGNSWAVVQLVHNIHIPVIHGYIITYHLTKHS